MTLSGGIEFCQGLLKLNADFLDSYRLFTYDPIELYPFLISSLKRCASIKPTESVDWVEICLLAIALLVGVLSFVAAIAVCCLYSK